MSARFPEWIRRRWGSGTEFAYTKEILQDLGLHTVCQSARCPNMGECWQRRTATFMILGNVCTRHCAFCSVRPGTPETPAPDEPKRVAEAVGRLGLRLSVVTSVTRDDLPDGGAEQFAQTVRAIRARNPQVAVEVLTPDFGRDSQALATVLETGPEVFGHNIETVRRLYPHIRDGRADYDASLEVLRQASAWDRNVLVKSAIMAGHGETEGEILKTLSDLYAVGARAVALGQYLQPSPEAIAVTDYVRPEQFQAYETAARAMGFTHVVSGPFVRSSYHAEEVLADGRAPRKDDTSCGMK